MYSQILGLRVASVIFGLMSIAQLMRLLIRPEVLVAGHPMPLWPSALAFIVLGVNISESTFRLSDWAPIEPNFFLGLLAYAGLAYLLIRVPMRNAGKQ